MPLERQMNRCKHSVYLASDREEKTGRAHYCGLCRVQSYELPNPKKTERRFVMPGTFGAGDKEKQRANSSSPNRCPKCQSYFRYEIPKSKTVTCAECNTEYKRSAAA